jgi:hypothetical protein
MCKTGQTYGSNGLGVGIEVDPFRCVAIQGGSKTSQPILRGCFEQSCKDNSCSTNNAEFGKSQRLESAPEQKPFAKAKDNSCSTNNADFGKSQRLESAPEQKPFAKAKVQEAKAKINFSEEGSATNLQAKSGKWQIKVGNRQECKWFIFINHKKAFLVTDTEFGPSGGGNVGNGHMCPIYSTCWMRVSWEDGEHGEHGEGWYVTAATMQKIEWNGGEKDGWSTDDFAQRDGAFFERWEAALEIALEKYKAKVDDVGEDAAGSAPSTRRPMDGETWHKTIFSSPLLSATAWCPVPLVCLVVVYRQCGVICGHLLLANSSPTVVCGLASGEGRDLQGACSSR